MAADAAADWETLSFLFTTIGLLLVVLGMAGAGRELTGVRGAVEALVICGFLTLFSAFILTALIRYDAIDNTDEVKYSHAALCYLTVILVVIGVAIYGLKKSRRPPPYAATLLIAGSLCSTLAGTFVVLLLTDN